jgi:hypothetical protein
MVFFFGPSGCLINKNSSLLNLDLLERDKRRNALRIKEERKGAKIGVRCKKLEFYVPEGA